MIELSLLKGDVPTTGVIVIPVATGQPLAGAAARIDAACEGRLARAVAMDGGLKHGKTREIVLPAGTDHERIVLLGLGKEGRTSRLQIEEAGAALVGALAGKAEEAVLLPLSGNVEGHDATAAMAAIATGARLKSYRFEQYKKPDADAPGPLKRLLICAEGGVAPDLAEVNAATDGVALARDLVSEPANVLYPASYAERCKALEELGVEVEVLDRARLEELGMGALLAVNAGSAREPFVVVMKWNGAGGGDAPLALVGKGVCFDTGGISIKPAAGMEGMKWDMGGSAAVVGAMHALAARKAKVDVVGVIGLVENMPSGTAQRPGDVVTAMSGTTIEVINTDAEGRLVLADVLWYTKETFRPKAMIDLATLTGAVIVALGHENAGLFANDDELAGALSEAAAETGEGLWRLPLGENYDKHIRSDIAEIKNVGRAREAGSTAGAVFLQRFVGDVPWAHLDIAGTAWTSRELPLVPKGGTGFGVRLLDRLIASRYEG